MKGKEVFRKVYFKQSPRRCKALGLSPAETPEKPGTLYLQILHS